MTANPEQQRFEDILATCMTELLTELGVSAERLTADHEPLSLHESMTAFCGFGSTDLRGSVTILGSLPLLSRLHPLPATVTPRDLADWACEFVNQTVGRYRNRLLAYNVSLALGVPQSALAENVRLSSRLRRRTTPLCYKIDGMVLEIWLELSIRPGFILKETSAADEDSAALKEGSILFF
jgi:hypothetical protein